MEKKYSIEELRKFYPQHPITDAKEAVFIKDYFQFGNLALDAKISKTQPVFKNGQPLLWTKPFTVSSNDFSSAIGITTECLFAHIWFCNYCTTDKKHPQPYINLADTTQASTLLAIAHWDQTRNWFLTGLDSTIRSTKKATHFIKNEQPESGTGQDIWIINLDATYAQNLWQNCLREREIIIEKSESYL